jgi:hypothetical protein
MYGQQGQSSNAPQLDTFSDLYSQKPRPLPNPLSLLLQPPLLRPPLPPHLLLPQVNLPLRQLNRLHPRLARQPQPHLLADLASMIPRRS